MNSSNLSRSFKLLFGWPLSLLALIFIIRFLSPNATSLFTSLTHIHWEELMLGMFFLLCYFVLRALLWQKIIQLHGGHKAYKATAYFWALAELKRYIPGNILSIASRIVHFSDEEMSKKQAGLAYAQEAMYIVLGSLVVASLGFNFFFSNGLHIPKANIWANIGIVGLVLIVFVFFVTSLQRSKATAAIYSANKNASPLSGLAITNEHFFAKLNLLSLSALAFFFFGLGHFFIISSLYYLPINSIYILTGFFTLSYILGYLSFIMPSGLGVREGIITMGLTKLLTISNAAFAAIFSRIFLIFAELIFFVLIAIWYKTKLKFVNHIEDILTRYPQITLLTMFAIAYNVYFSLASILRYINFYTGRFDLGNMAQTVWNTEHGRIFQLTDPNGIYTVSRLATHADFLLVLLVPFYWLWSDPRMLLIVQTLVLSLGAYFVYLIAKEVLKNRNLALVFATIYLLNPSVERTNIYDFHAVTLATTFLLAALYFILKKRLGWFLLFGILAGLTKEQVWFTVGLLAIFYGVKHKQYITGIVMFILMTAMSYALIAIAIPDALGKQHFALSYYSDFGDKPTTVIKNIFSSPIKTISILFLPERLHYAQQILSPLGYLSIFAPVFLLFALPEITIYMLSNNPNLYQIYYQYTATITPFIFISAIYGVRNISIWFSNNLTKKQFNTTFFIYFLIFFTILTSYLYGPLPGAVEANTDMFTKQVTDAVFVDQFLSQIPKRYSVAASNNLGSHLSQRKNIYTTPFGANQADVIALLLTDSNPPVSVMTDQQLANKLLYESNYVIWYRDGPFIVFRKSSLPDKLRK